MGATKNCEDIAKKTVNKLENTEIFYLK